MAGSIDTVAFPVALPDLPGDWEYALLGELVEDRGICYGIVQPGTVSDDGAPVLRVNNIRNGRIDATDVLKVDPAIEAKFQRSRLRGGEVLLTLVGTLGEVAIVPETMKGWNVARAVGVLPVRQDPGSRWVAICLRSVFCQHCIRSWATTTVQATFNLRDVANLPIPLPPAGLRDRIAHILGTLDDKIELNRRMNATLEGISRAIFKSWFMDFDPVRQKAAGQQPVGMDAQTAALFPDSFEDSEIGEVPKGWAVDAFADHFDADRGLSYKGDGLREDGSGLPMHNLNSIYEGGGYKHGGIKYYAGEYRDKHLIAPGDVIVTNTEQGFDHLLIGHAAVVPECFGAVGLYSHHIYRLRCKPPSPLTPHYVVSLLNDPRCHYWVSGFSNGTTINMLPLDALQMPLLVVPPVRLVQAFDHFATAAHERCEANLQASSRLAALRDTLLPKLISGDIRIPEAEQAVEEAVR
jgi:type I restriction enzyme, S subunit